MGASPSKNLRELTAEEQDFLVTAYPELGLADYDMSFKKIVVTPLEFPGPNGEKYVVPKEFVLDGCSSPVYNGTENECIVHDWLYAMHAYRLNGDAIDKPTADLVLTRLAQDVFKFTNMDDDAWRDSYARGAVYLCKHDDGFIAHRTQHVFPHLPANEWKVREADLKKLESDFVDDDVE